MLVASRQQLCMFSNDSLTLNGAVFSPSHGKMGNTAVYFTVDAELGQKRGRVYTDKRDCSREYISLCMEGTLSE